MDKNRCLSLMSPCNIPGATARDLRASGDAAKVKRVAKSARAEPPSGTDATDSARRERGNDAD